MRANNTGVAIFFAELSREIQSITVRKLVYQQTHFQTLPNSSVGNAVPVPVPGGDRGYMMGNLVVVRGSSHMGIDAFAVL